VVVTLIVGLGGLACLIKVEQRIGNTQCCPSLFALRSIVGANLFTALLYGEFRIMLNLIPFAMIRGTQRSTLVASLALIPCKC
jgi:hypothetical protein